MSRGMRNIDLCLIALIATCNNSHTRQDICVRSQRSNIVLLNPCGERNVKPGNRRQLCALVLRPYPDIDCDLLKNSMSPRMALYTNTSFRVSRKRNLYSDRYRLGKLILRTFADFLSASRGRWLS